MFDDQCIKFLYKNDEYGFALTHMGRTMQHTEHTTTLKIFFTFLYYFFYFFVYNHLKIMSYCDM